MIFPFLVNMKVFYHSFFSFTTMFRKSDFIDIITISWYSI